MPERTHSVDKLSDFSSRGLHELRMWMETWFRVYDTGSKKGCDICLPNPCLPGSGGGSGTFPPGTSYPDAVTILAGMGFALRANWRLGEGALPYVNSTGNHSFTDMTNLTAGGGGTGSFTYDQTPGLLPTGSDDGAIAFNVQGGSSGSPYIGQYLSSTGAGGSNFDVSPNHPFSFSCWIYPFSPTFTWTGSIFSSASGNFGPSDPFVGWSLELNYTAGSPNVFLQYRHVPIGSSGFTLTSTFPITTVNTHFVFMTYDGSVVTLYVDGVAVGSGVDPVAHTSFSSFFTPNMGNTPFGAGATGHPYYGILDEVTMWSGTPTPGEIRDLYGTVASTPPGWVLTVGPDCNFVLSPIGTGGSVSSGTAPAGQVLASDGAGGTTWDWADHGVYVNGA